MYSSEHSKMSYTTSEAVFGKSKTTKLLKEMCQKGVITVEGKGKGTKYIIS